MNILAIDQGTTSTRGVLLTPDSAPRVVRSLAHAQGYPQRGWVEHDPAELLANVRACLAATDADAVAIDNQGESCLGWDSETGEPVSPVIVWQDDRTQAAVDALAREGAGDEVLARAGLPLDAYFSASKLAWILDNVPTAKALHARGRLRLGTTDAFFAQHLARSCVTDVTTASRTSLMNLNTGEWDPELCDLFGVPIDCLPRIVPTTGEHGRVVAGSRNALLACLVVDQQAALYGHGCRSPGQAKITFGTGAFALMVTGGTRMQAPERGLLPTVAWQREDESRVYALDGGVYCASAAVNWARELRLFDAFAEINAFEGDSAIERDLVFVPALAGLACPHWDRAARGAWLGASLATDRGDLVRAVLEGVALRAAEVLAEMNACHPLWGHVSVDGGMTANPYFVQFLADVLNREIAVAEHPELTAIGGGQLAADALGKSVRGAGEARVIRPLANLGSARRRFAEAVNLVRRWPGS